MPSVRFLSDSSRVNDLLKVVAGGLAFDIGANGGHLANLLARRFARVIAVEPCEESYKELEASHADNVTPVNVAASAAKGWVTMRETSLTDHWGELFTGYSLPWGEDRGTREVPTTTVDLLRQEYGRPDFIKIDTEGHEQKVLEGCGTLFEHKVQFCIEVHDATQGQWIQEYLTDREQPFYLERHEAYQPSGEPWLNHYWLTNLREM